MKQMSVLVGQASLIPNPSGRQSRTACGPFFVTGVLNALSSPERWLRLP